LSCVATYPLNLREVEAMMMKYSWNTNSSFSSDILDNGPIVLPKSPVHVVDFSSIIDLETRCSFHTLYAPELGRSHGKCAASLAEAETMTKDSVTVPCSTTTDYDNDETNSIVSSLSSHSLSDAETNAIVQEVSEETSDKGSTLCTKEERRRSIFSPYWKTTGQEPLQLMQEHSCMTRSFSNPRLSLLNLEEAQNELEQVTSRIAVPHPPPSTTSKQRSIFGGSIERSEIYSSFRSLPEMCATPSQAQMECAPKRRSISCLRRSEPLVSCLRKSSTLSSSKKVSSHSSSVSFDAQIQVITYQVPLQHWSNGSWLKLFGME
jgi:hypothetical protein